MFPPESIQAKIERANEHIDTLETEINSLIESDVYRLASEPEADARKSIISVVGPSPPLRFAVVVGEIIHALRSCLDHLICQLVIINGHAVTRDHQFPICDTPETFKAARRRGYMKGVSASARALIEELQPYKKSKENIKANVLYLLREMDNADKHRLLAVVATLANVRELRIGGDLSPRPDRESATIVGLDPPKKAQRPTKKGTAIQRIHFADPEPSVEITGKPVIQVVFDDLGPMTEQPVTSVVQQLRDWTVSLINEFGEEFPP